MKKLILLLFTLGMLSIPNKSFAQLVAGDIAFIGYNTDSGPAASTDHSFSFIALTDIPGNEVIYFTEEGWNDDTNAWVGNTEGHIQWTAPVAGTACGTILYITESGADTFTITGGGTATLISGSGWNLSAGDQVLAYQAATPEATNPTFISAIHGNDGDGAALDPVTLWDEAATILASNSKSCLPSGLTNGVNCVALFTTPLTEQDNAKYTGTLTGTSTVLRSAINDRNNWSFNNTTAFDITPTAYSPSVTCVAPCSEPDVPTVAYTPTTVCSGGTASLNITGNLNDATTWNVYTGSCGGTLIGSTTTGTFAIPGTISTTTDYFVRGEGGCATPGSCGSTTITVTPLEDASFSYGSVAYCANESDPTPTITGVAGGTFSSSPAGLSLNASAGAIDVSASTPGTYTITYTTAGVCPNSSSVAVTVNATDDASFSYSASSFCSNGADPIPTITGLAGGTFSSSAGLSINASTGEIDLSLSTPDAYVITYTTAGTCPNTANVAVLISNPDNASFSYPSTSYCVNATDPTPTVTGLGGGTFSSTAGLSLNIFSGIVDLSASTTGTYSVTYTTNGSCPNSSSASITINALDDASFSYDAATYCANASDPTPTITGLAGGTFSSTGGLILNTSTGALDVSASTPGTYTVSYTTAGVCPNSSSASITINALDDASFSYNAASYATNDSDPTPTITGLTGGTFSSTAGLSINASTGEIDLSASSIATYNVTYTTAGSCPNSSIASVSITSSDVTWTGTTSNDWSTASNWNTNTVPSSTADITIPNGLTNYPTSSTSITVNSMTIQSGATFIANSAVTGPVTYQRELFTTNWYLVSAPVDGETQQDVIANHTFASGSGSNIGLGAYSNNTGPSWIYSNAASMGPIPSGFGVSMKLAAPGIVSITGTVNTSNVSYLISQGTRDNFNLLGNPYTSYINSATFASVNTGALTEETIWLWDGSQYVTYNAVSPINLAPAQGFFVEASGSSNVVYSTANQSHQNTDTFMRQEPTTNFELFVENGDTKQSTKVFYVANKTTGFDNGYDSKLFGGATSDFTIFTELVSNNQGKQLAIQTLPNDNFETMIVPVGIIAEAGKEITFSVESLNLPQNISVFLEDRLNGEFINLSENTYKTTLATASNGIGQFYIHTTSQKLSTDDLMNSLADISVYKSAKQEITITGLQANAKVALFSILGKKSFATTITSNGISKVALPHLADGVYIVKLSSEYGEVTRKIILD